MTEKRTVKITEGECMRLERLHFEYNSLLEVERAYLDAHMADGDGSAIDSPVYAAYHARTVEALRDYERAKAELVASYSLEGLNWSIRDFTTCEVEVG